MVPDNRLLEIQRQLDRFAQSHTVAIVVGPPPSANEPVHTASGCILRHEEHTFLITADHVLAHLETSRQSDARVVCQVFVPGGSQHSSSFIIDPVSRVRDRNPHEDVVAIDLAPEVIERVGAPVFSTPLGFPPPPAQPGDLIAISGYPKVYRLRDSHKEFTFRALSAVFEVTASGEFHLLVKWERETILSLDGPGVPDQPADLGGMSGGPVLLVRDLAYPLVGIVTDFGQDFELMRMAHLSALRL